MEIAIDYDRVDRIIEDMTPYTATGIAEGFIEANSPNEQVAAWQYLVNTGMAWQLQGFFGRTAEALIEQGIISRAITA